VFCKLLENNDQCVQLSKVNFNQPYVSPCTLPSVTDVLRSNNLSGNGPLTKACEEHIQSEIDCKRALITNSCTAALEIAALLCDLTPGDEVIMPSFTFVSTALAFVRVNAVPVFIDIRPDTKNINETLIEEAINERTKAIVVVHYAGIMAEMDKLAALAKKYNLILIEDAAQSYLSSYQSRSAGTFGDLATFSFHETKNISCGEGGALLINNEEFQERAEIIREKGTNRQKFLSGAIDKYTWTDLGSSFLASEISAAVLLPQLINAQDITNKRVSIWNYYMDAFSSFNLGKHISLPYLPEKCSHNGHMFYLVMQNKQCREEFIKNMKLKGIQCAFHYVPLHSSPAGRNFCKTHAEMDVTDQISNGLVRLPLWPGLEIHQDFIIQSVFESLDMGSSSFI
jgi:dTDP-4-amino-4,6-dideoxygalactose transaminase